MEECIMELEFILAFVRCSEYVARMGKVRNAYKILVSKSNWKTLLEI
jgi:hypothetical protein